MNIQKIVLTVGKTRFVIEASHPQGKPPTLKVRDETLFFAQLTRDSGEEQCWELAHDMFSIGHGYRGSSGDVRALQMLLSLSIP